ncbi:hypothetical protein PTSG_12900 [Salpingoeca rosetta]|uniref:Sulfotransferase domain-containing protein n=1 Tax=Salpingoeca rosetta (strain ATCC 50818 / BSB-021) TaxID=946362 RepID=F2ULC4_SALR5|nr:uncharacterized protein PTSG_12900 [Salpingoeca rosetta]EGD77923.1 hypothetical protein PTSG_12900 [Salpingoeca rosetta]|eukprot:XP_004989987.1 hypothetical protein PTSG_12900 [Salpingoeca rosetta]
MGVDGRGGGGGSGSGGGNGWRLWWKVFAGLLAVAVVVYVMRADTFLASEQPQHLPIPVLRRALGTGLGSQGKLSAPASRGFDVCQDGTNWFSRYSEEDVDTNSLRESRNHRICAGSRPMFTISHPKSGRTWLRCLVANAYACARKNASLSLSETEAWSDKVLSFSHGKPHPFGSTPQQLLNGFGTNNGAKREAGFMLVRDPRDVVVSSFYDRMYRDWEHSLPKHTSLSEYLRIERGSLQTLLMHQNLWSSVTDKPDWLVLRYEDLKRCPEKALDELLNKQLCLDVSPACIARAADWCDFSKLQQRADSASHYGGGKIWRPKGHDPNSRKVRKGKVGGYREELSAEDMEYLESSIQEHLLGGRVFGYNAPPPKKN